MREFPAPIAEHVHVHRIHTWYNKVSIMFELKMFPAANGSRNMYAIGDPLARSF